jgi:cytochrome c oxidase assembly factor CtaG
LSTGTRWPLERVLFFMAGTVTIAGASQWMYVAFGDCPSSLVMRRLFGLQGCAR